MHKPNNIIGPSEESCPHNWRRLWGSLRVGAGGGGVNSLASKGSRRFLRLRRHAVVVPTQTSARGYALQCQQRGQP